MFLYGTNMPLIIFAIIIVEISILFNQWFIYLTRPKEKKRLYHLLLLLLLIFYNLAEGFFPDKRVAAIPDVLQNFLGYGFGYVFASYCPMFFYGGMELEELRFHGKFGFLFILAPVIVFYFMVYPINHNLSFTRKFVYIIPGIYAMTIFVTALRVTFKHYRRNHNKGALQERLLVFLSVFPISVTPIFGGWMGLDKWIITTIFNIGFLIVNGIYMRQVVWLSRSEQDKLLELSNIALTIGTIAAATQQDVYLKKYRTWGLTKREIEIVELVAKGLEYKRIGEQLYISDKTVKKHVQNIFVKAGVSTRSLLMHALNK
jgi:DNA-binding CsgD family transcriptional regulator